MPRVIPSRRAVADLDQLWDYIAERNVDAADRKLALIEERCDLHAAFPETGQARPELGDQVRCFSIGSYVIFYRPAPDGLELLRVLHGARQIEDLF
jgi:toxin ParE1/3/4